MQNVLILWVWVQIFKIVHSSILASGALVHYWWAIIKDRTGFIEGLINSPGGERRYLDIFFFFFKGRTHSIWKFPGYRSNWSCSFRPIPQPQQGQILNPVSEARGRTHVLMDISQIHYCWATMETPGHALNKGKITSPACKITWMQTWPLLHDLSHSFASALMDSSEAPTNS